MKQQILVVEDEAIVRESLGAWFSDEGYKVVMVKNGEEALEKINAENIGIAILDLRLPDKDGIQILKEAKSRKPQLKTIIITAYPTKESQEEAIRLGAINYLIKPFLPQTINKILEATTEKGVTKNKECLWMKLGLVSYRLCVRNYDCLSCEFDQTMQDKKQTEVKIDTNLPGNKRLCRYALRGDISYRLCSKVYKCESCEFNQNMEEGIATKINKLEKRREALKLH